MSPSPIHDKLTYLCYYLAAKHPHVLTDAENFVGGMLAENSQARERAGRAAENLSESYKEAHQYV